MRERDKLVIEVDGKSYYVWRNDVFRKQSMLVLDDNSGTHRVVAFFKNHEDAEALGHYLSECARVLEAADVLKLVQRNGDGA